MKHIDAKTLKELKAILESEKANLCQELGQIGVENLTTGDWMAVPAQTDGEAEAEIGRASCRERV